MLFKISRRAEQSERATRAESKVEIQTRSRRGPGSLISLARHGRPCVAKPRLASEFVNGYGPWYITSLKRSGRDALTMVAHQGTSGEGLVAIRVLGLSAD